MTYQIVSHIFQRQLLFISWHLSPSFPESVGHNHLLTPLKKTQISIWLWLKSKNLVTFISKFSFIMYLSKITQFLTQQKKLSLLTYITFLKIFKGLSISP